MVRELDAAQEEFGWAATARKVAVHAYATGRIAKEAGLGRPIGYC